MPAVNDVGKPCAGEPHARFDGRELETEQTRAMVTAVGHPDGKPRELEGCRTYRTGRATAPVPDPPCLSWTVVCSVCAPEPKYGRGG
jgi:hypothetical protein